MGVLGWSLLDFQGSAPAEVLRALAWKQHYDEQAEKDAWDRARWITYIMARISPHVKKVHKPQDVIVFPWEKTETKVQTPEERAQSIEILKKMDERQMQKHGGE